jgi:hypothetical protein
MTTSNDDGEQQDDPCDDWTGESRPLSQVLQEGSNSDKRIDKRSDRGESKSDILRTELAEKKRQ